MSVLGIGSRVMVHAAPEIDPDAWARTGTIDDGPHEAGTECKNPVTGGIFKMPERFWGVTLDGESASSAIYERHLTPIDGGETQEMNQVEELEA